MSLKGCGDSFASFALEELEALGNRPCIMFCENAHLIGVFAVNPTKNCYCRECIAEWVSGRKEWKSPLTNRTHYGYALLAQDLLRAGASLEYHRNMIHTLPPIERFKMIPYAFFGFVPLCTSEECASVLEDKSVLALVRRDSPHWHSAFLEVCWRAKALERYPADCVIEFCRHEQRSEEPFVQREIVRALLEACGSKYKTAPLRKLRAALLECRAHYIWRLQQVDAIFVPPERAPGASALLLVRNSYTPPSSNCSHWSSRSGACMSLPRLPAYKSCLQEPTQCDITLKSSCGATYRSQIIVGMEEKSIWRRRRGPPLCFPESSGDAASVASSDSTEAISVSSDALSSSDSQAESSSEVTTKSEKMTSHEESVWILPEGFEYIPRVKKEDEIQDTSGTLAEIDHLLVSEMLGKRTRADFSSHRAHKRMRASN